MGVVYKAFDTDTKRNVIIKIINLDAPDSPSLDSFKQEYFILNAIRHPRIVHVHNFSEIWAVDGRVVPAQYYMFSMDYIEGTDLTTFFKNCTDEKRAIEIIGEILETIHFLHYQGFIHNDLRSNNILISPDGLITIIDFSLAEPLNSTAQINAVRCANEWKTFFELLQRALSNKKFPIIQSFISDALVLANARTLLYEEEVLALFSRSFPENAILPTFLKHPGWEYTPFNIGLVHQFTPIQDFIDKETFKNKVLFLIGDLYSSARTHYFFTLGYLRYVNNVVITLDTDNILDVLHLLITSLMKYDLEKRFVDPAIPEVSAIIDRSASHIANERMYALYARVVSILQKFTQNKNLAIAIPNYALKNESFHSFIMFLLKAQGLSNLTVVLYNETQDLSLRKSIPEDFYDTKIFLYDFLTQYEVDEMVAHCLLIPERRKKSYSSLYKALFEKTNAKSYLVVAMLQELISKKIITFKDGHYVYNIEDILAYPFSFSFEERWKKIIDNLTPEETAIVSIVAFFDRTVSANELKFILCDLSSLPAIVENLVKRNILLKSSFSNVHTYHINGDIFTRFIQNNITSPSQYLRRALLLSVYSVDSNPSIENISFLIQKLYHSSLNLQYVTIKYIILLLDKYDRNVDRKEVIRSAEILRDIIKTIPHRTHYNNALMHLAIFHYFNREDSVAFDTFASIDVNCFYPELQLKYYLSFSKNASFFGKADLALSLCQKGKIIAKKLNNIHYRYYFLNVAGLIYSNIGKREIAYRYYFLVFHYVKKYGMSPELLNFASNFSFQLTNLGRYEDAINAGNELIKALLKDTYHNKLSRIYVFLRNTYAAELLERNDEALHYLEEAYVLAKEIQSIDDILTILARKNDIKKKIQQNPDEIREEQEKIIEIARQYGREIQLSDTYYSLINRSIDSGELQKALDYFTAALREIAVPSKKTIVHDYVQFMFVGARLFSILGDFYKAHNMLSLARKNIERLDGFNKSSMLLNYFEVKAHYYFQKNQMEKGIHWLTNHIDLLREGIDSGKYTVESAEIVTQYAALLEQYHAIGNKTMMAQCWEKIGEYNTGYDNLQVKYYYVNWFYIRALLTDNNEEKTHFFESAIEYTIHAKDFMIVEKVIGEYLRLLPPDSLLYKNIVLLLYISVVKFYTNTPEQFRQHWLNKPKIVTFLPLLNTLVYGKNTQNSVLDEDFSSIFARFTHTVHSSIKKNNLKIMKSFNKDIWKTHPNHYPKKFADFLKEYLCADRVIIATSDTVTEDAKIIVCNEGLYRDKSHVDPVLIQNAYHSGDYLIENTYNFGSSLSTLVIPIVNPYNKNSYYNKDKRLKSVSISDYYLGYIYIDSKYPIANINTEAVDMLKIYIEWYSSLLTYNLINYELVLDKLTSLFTRTHFLKNLKNKLVSIKEKKQTIAFMILDIDHFKKVNDTYGHQKGDEVLTRIASIIKRNVRRNDLAGRYGGEEFIIALMNISKKEAEKKAEEIRRVIQNTSILPDRKITVSIGCALFPDDAEWVNILINKADSALYHAKSHGRNQVVFWNPEISGMKQTKDVLSEILSTDLARSEHIIRSIFELIDVEPTSLEHLIQETITQLSACVPAHYFYYRFEAPHCFVESDNTTSILYDKEKVEELTQGPSIMVNWNYFKEKNEDIHYDLVYKLHTFDCTCLVIFSSPTSKVEYSDTHSNLLDKIFKLFRNKYADFRAKTLNTDPHQ